MRRARIALSAPSAGWPSADDRALLAGMRRDDAGAWAAYMARFRPRLYAIMLGANLYTIAGMPARDALVDEVLTDEALRLTRPGAPDVTNIGGWLVRAAQHKLVDVRRLAQRRERHYRAAASWFADTPWKGERAIVPALHSAHGLRASGALREDAEASPAVLGLAAAIVAVVSEKDRVLLGWLAEGVPHRTIAGWLGVSYEAATKRAWRLTRQLRASVAQFAAALPPEQRAEVARLLRRAGLTCVTWDHQPATPALRRA
jgi:DNA-directed RNA polymerase specialized sigma24 family protein